LLRVNRRFRVYGPEGLRSSVKRLNPRLATFLNKITLRVEGHSSAGLIRHTHHAFHSSNSHKYRQAKQGDEGGIVFQPSLLQASQGRSMKV